MRSSKENTPSRRSSIPTAMYRYVKSGQKTGIIVINVTPSEEGQQVWQRAHSVTHILRTILKWLGVGRLAITVIAAARTAYGAVTLLAIFWSLLGNGTGSLLVSSLRT